jgi:hypothetical protein
VIIIELIPISATSVLALTFAVILLCLAQQRR